jgi:serine/threonine protein kinase
MEPAKPKPSYTNVQKLGEGSYGDAFLVKEKNSGEFYVMKTVNMSQMDADERRKAEMESRILKKLSHPNIVSFQDVYKTKKNGVFTLHIVMEHCDDGELKYKIDELRERNEKSGKKEYFSETKVLNWFTQICLGVKHCHDRKIIHRDIKSQNVFLMKSGAAKIGDFGVSTVLK